MKKIYFDNAATNNFKPRSVIKTLVKYTKNQFNAGHGNNSISIMLNSKIWEVREKIANYYNLDKPENVVFTKNCTEALNIVVHGIKFDASKNNVVVSTFEHNSLLRPLYKLKEDGKITLTIVRPRSGNTITAEDVLDKISDKTMLVCVCSYSNVTGNKNEISQIGKMCKQKNILFLVDDAQGAGHDRINIKKYYVSFLTFSGHKGFFSPQGVGALLINCNEKLAPLMQGGTGTNSEFLSQPTALPEMLESGTIMSPIIISLGKGIDYLEKNEQKIHKKLSNLSSYLLNELNKIKDIDIYSKNKIGIVAFSHKYIDSVKLSNALDEKYNIVTRSGLHCAPLTHDWLNTTKNGVVRISVNQKNSLRQIKYFVKCLKIIIMTLN